MDHWLPRAAAMHPKRVALAIAGAQITYAELDASARIAAGALRERGVSRGGRVALALPADEKFVAALHGCMLTGAVAVPIDLRLRARERADRARGTDAVVERALRGPILATAEPLALAATATVMHTSGTTANPRPVTLSYANWLAAALGSAAALGLDQQEQWLCPLPLAHVGGLSILIRSVIYGTTVVLHERFDPDAVAAELMDRQRRVTLVSLVPTMLARVLDSGLRAPPTLRWALLGGGPIAPALLARAAAAEVPVAPTYGMTEACSQIATHGWPLPGVELRTDPDGEVLVRGATVAPSALASDGWLHTGDIGSLDRRGRLTIAGRKADTIVSGGENVAPAEVEAVLLEHPAVADAAVHARAHPEWGEAVVATVVLRAGLSVDAEELQALCGARLAGYKVPKAVEFAESLPRSASGKLLRRRLTG
jgi:O-succinylbenzoic acid--CoA ligase